MSDITLAERVQRAGAVPALSDQQLREIAAGFRSTSSLPTFDDFEQERRHRKLKLAAAFRIFGKLGFDEGVMGHISVRDPEYPDLFWMNPFGVSFDVIKASDLLLLNLKGDLIEGEGLRHPGGFPLHAGILAARPDVVSAVHTHAPYTKAWSITGKLLEPVSTESARFYKRHAIFDTFKGGEGEQLRQALVGNRAVILKNHGLVTTGKSVDEAAYAFISLEKEAKVQFQAAASGLPIERIDEEHALKISAGFTPEFGWFNFQPLYQSILRQQPDLLD